MTVDVIFTESFDVSEGKSDPRWPNGRPVILANAGEKFCSRNLPYPAPKCGSYEVKCLDCGKTATIAVAGRPDDPRIIVMRCGD